ncbi:MAG TPA: hypothetical protein VFK79_05340 [Xanthobacteraceae bacterium]|nr:hypothetical protein [Xanthobacteraceae bacterium]
MIWSTDISDPLKPEVISTVGLPWQKSDTVGLGNDPPPNENARRARPATRSRQPEVLRLVGRRRRGNRLHRSTRTQTVGPRQLDAALCRLDDITTDEHGRLFLIDRWNGGMHSVEYTG